MRSRLITLKVSQELLDMVDEASKANLITRSGYIRQALTMRLNDEHLVPNPKPDDILELLRQAGKH